MFIRVFPCTKHITGEETIKILLEEWFSVYGAPKEINSDEDVRVRSDPSLGPHFQGILGFSVDQNGPPQA